MPLSNTRRASGPRVIGEGADLWTHDATLALCMRLGYDVDPSLVTPHVEAMTRPPLRFFAEHALRLRGIAFDPHAAPEEIFALALAMDGPDHVSMGSPAFHRPGSFPNLLSNLASKILDEGLDQADVTYPIWAGRSRQDLPDFKGAPIVAKGTAGELDELLDGEVLPELALGEEMLGMLALGRFGNQVKFTPVLAANDDLGAFAEDLLGLAAAHELTLNRLCLHLLVLNPELLDGFALFDDTNHGNDIDANGDGPSVAEWEAMQRKLAAQRTVGDTAFVRARLAIALVSPHWEVAAQQTFLPFRDVGENKQPATDSNLNVYRGRVSVAVEPELQEVGPKLWYGLCDPRRFGQATIVYAYMRGWGRQGKRERWYDPSTKCFHVSLEGRFAAGAKQYRTIVRNKGEA